MIDSLLLLSYARVSHCSIVLITKIDFDSQHSKYLNCEHVSTCYNTKEKSSLSGIYFHLWTYFTCRPAAPPFFLLLWRSFSQNENLWKSHKMQSTIWSHETQACLCWCRYSTEFSVKLEKERFLNFLISSSDSLALEVETWNISQNLNRIFFSFHKFFTQKAIFNFLICFNCFCWLRAMTAVEQVGQTCSMNVKW